MKAGMKSGSLRAMPTPPNATTVCGTSSSTCSVLPTEASFTSGTPRRSALAGKSPKIRSSTTPSSVASISPTTPIFRLSRASTRPTNAFRSSRWMSGTDFQRAVGRPPIRMIRECRLPPQPRADVVRARGLALERRHHLRADALHRLGVEARRGERQLQQIRSRHPCDRTGPSASRGNRRDWRETTIRPR